ncbi:MAG TPA: hypothetical protein VFY56_15180 [Propionibacteriaceae bacterium]|nr:hypothetical protein [Propionibacteriaceae bacterium]
MIIVWGQTTVRISPAFPRQDLVGITVALGSFDGRAIAVELVGRLIICISRLATVDECLIGEFDTFCRLRMADVAASAVANLSHDQTYRLTDQY